MRPVIRVSAASTRALVIAFALLACAPARADQVAAKKLYDAIYAKLLVSAAEK